MIIQVDIMFSRTVFGFTPRSVIKSISRHVFNTYFVIKLSYGDKPSASQNNMVTISIDECLRLIQTPILIHGNGGKYVSRASYQIRKFTCCACAGNAGNVFPATAGYLSRHASRHVRDVRAVMHVGIDNLRCPLKSVAGKTAHAQTARLRIWQEAHERIDILFLRPGFTITLPFWYICNWYFPLHTYCPHPQQ